ncbi:hypothetical protein BH23GEM10_BH23GEM10_01810 [soil metagenome]
MIYAYLLLQTVTALPDERGLGQTILDFVDSPAPYSPFSEYLLLLFVLWLIARRENRKQTFDTQAQDVLDEKYAKGELSKQAYDKHRQNMATRPKR